MKVKLIPIGNSKGIRIPKALLDQCGFGDAVDLEVREGSLVLRPAPSVRAGWDEAFKTMAADGDDRLEAWPAPAWDDSEWEWK